MVRKRLIVSLLLYEQSWEICPFCSLSEDQNKIGWFLQRKEIKKFQGSELSCDQQACDMGSHKYTPREDNYVCLSKEWRLVVGTINDALFHLQHKSHISRLQARSQKFCIILVGVKLWHVYRTEAVQYVKGTHYGWLVGFNGMSTLGLFYAKDVFVWFILVEYSNFLKTHFLSI